MILTKGLAGKKGTRYTGILYGLYSRSSYSPEVSGFGLQAAGFQGVQGLVGFRVGFTKR